MLFRSGCGRVFKGGDEEDGEITFPKADFEMNFAVRRRLIFCIQSLNFTKKLVTKNARFRGQNL